MKHACRARRGGGNAARSLSCGLSRRGEGEGEEDVAENGSLFFFFRIDRFDTRYDWRNGSRVLCVANLRRNRRIEMGCVYIYIYV